jgi:hypothetical protein
MDFPVDFPLISIGFPDFFNFFLGSCELEHKEYLLELAGSTTNGTTS